MVVTASRRSQAPEHAQPSRTTVVAAPDRLAVAVLVALPLLVFALPALLGHTVLLGDDFSQNYPLRAFVGSQIRHGHLPLFNPYIWSGAPLLGGWNAGAAYPFTWLFVILPATAAWTLNLLATWWVTGIGCFVFLRLSRLSAVPSFLGSLSFSFAGAMTAQVVHFGLVAGMSWVPVSLIALLQLSRSRALRSRLWWTALLAASAALVILAGEPRAITDYGAIVLVYAVWRVLKLGRNSGPFVAFCAIGVLLALALSAVQWIPGEATVTTSQRALSNTYLFSSGSWPNRWMALMLVPDLLGGSGSFGQPAFFASYNITEVTGYVGLLPLVAAFALLARLKLRRPVPEWLVWHVVALFGIALALGGNTPLWHVLIKIPFFGGQRLQSRNILIADMGFAFLLAYWADTWLRPRQEIGFGRADDPEDRVPNRPGDDGAYGRRARAERWFGSIPALGALATVVVAFAWGAGFLQWLGGVTLRAGTHDGSLRPWFIPFGVIGLAAAALVVSGHRLAPRLRTRVLIGFVILDIAIFTLTSVVQVAPGLGNSSSSASSAQVVRTSSPGATGVTPRTTLSAAHYAGDGRFAIYDPDLIDTAGLNTIGAPDLNVVLAVPSVQGYSSIVDGVYASATGSHSDTGLGQNVLDPKAVGDGTLDQLGTRVLFSPRDYFIVSTSSDIATPATGAGNRNLSPGSRATWYLGENLSVSRIEIPDSQALSDVTNGLRIGLVNGEGTIRLAPTSPGPDHIDVNLSRPEGAVAIVAIAGKHSAALGAPDIASEDGTTYVADGQLEGAVVPPRWGLRGIDGAFAVFEDHDAGPALAIRGSKDATVRAASGPVFAPSSAWVDSTGGAEVLRSEAAIAGWSATWHPRSGPTRELAVRRAGLIQAVDVPAGRGLVAWSYTPPRWTPAWVLSSCGLAGFCALCLLASLSGKRRSRVRWGRL